MEEIEFKGWKKCVQITSGDFRLVVTTEIGPRIIGAFKGESENMFYVDPETAGDKGGDEWKIYGGHRLWTSPEKMPRTYEVDNGPVEIAQTEDSTAFSSGTDPRTGIHKILAIKPLPGNSFEVEHKIINRGMWEIETAAWALSVMAPGGTSILPQPRGDMDALLPDRYMTIWPYTNMADPRVTWGTGYIMLRQDENISRKFKYGLNCEDGWMAYVNKGNAFVKRFKHLVDAEYPDNGCSVELFTNEAMQEIETLSPLYSLAPGEEIIHSETFQAFSGTPGIENEKDADAFFKKYIHSRTK